MTTLLVILALWVLLSVPLALIVARLLHKSDDEDHHHPDQPDDQRLRDLFALDRRR
ncbi:hypothetical protein DFR70_105437 [Nocardia tenerifensis]|uniref:Uncharacterized protein n=1 Tax=Nocardia tenerifensis TaxID=228006 RepID=A0A318JZY8_9NOCA|nr:transmembrane 9 family protein [Nocardia tenerifensis]PXX64252.1 hypothetical protein DFR70_105437 [Nocardia tenerifensis]